MTHLPDLYVHRNFFIVFQVEATLPSTFIKMLIHDWSHSNIELFLKSVPSCEQSGIMVFFSNGECPLIDERSVNGMNVCTFNCTAAQLMDAEITLGFVRQDRPPVWALCEINTVA